MYIKYTIQLSAIVGIDLGFLPDYSIVRSLMYWGYGSQNKKGIGKGPKFWYYTRKAVKQEWFLVLSRTIFVAIKNDFRALYE